MTTRTPDSIPSIDIELEYAVPADRLFACWTQEQHLRRWFAAEGYDVTDCTIDARADGPWTMTFAASNGHSYVESGRYLVLDPVSRVEMTLQQLDGEHIGPETHIRVDILDLGTRSRMVFHQAGFTDPGQRDGNADGWMTCFDKLGATLDAAPTPIDAGQQIRDLHEAWFAASERKDLDASMAPIADDVISYEHITPQVYHGVDAIRPICAAGFEHQTGDFRWDIPDLEIIVRGDIAVTWGLNRMAAHLPDGTERVEWSRGTRIFQRIDGAWKMIHQHVSFPMDPESGAISMER